MLSLHKFYHQERMEDESSIQMAYLNGIQGLYSRVSHFFFLEHIGELRVISLKKKRVRHRHHCSALNMRPFQCFQYSQATNTYYNKNMM